MFAGLLSKEAKQKCCLICFRGGRARLAPQHNLLNINDLKSFINTNFCFFHNDSNTSTRAQKQENTELYTASCLKLQLKICYRYESKLLQTHLDIFKATNRVSKQLNGQWRSITINDSAFFSRLQVFPPFAVTLFMINSHALHNS